MRVTSQDLDDRVAGTSAGDRLEAHAWRGGRVVAQDLLVASWSLPWDADRQIQGQGSFTIADPDGKLAPWSLEDPLGPGGSRLQLTWVTGGESPIRVPLGWWRLRASDPDETWRIGRKGDEDVQRVAGGGSVTVQADEETATVVMDRLDAETVTAPTCIAEVRRLLADIMPVFVDAGVTDAPAPRSLVYGDSRMDAVEDLLSIVNATYRMGPDGSLQVVPVAGVGPVWTLSGGDDGVLIKVRRSLSDEDVYNAGISAGQDAAGRPLVGRAYLESGPLAWGPDTPFGRVPIFHRAIAQTQSGVEADAKTLLRNRVAGGEVDLKVTCLTHPGIQIQDRVTVVAATTVGDAPLEGRVVGMTMRSATSEAGTTPAKAMELRVRVSTEALEAVAARVRRG